MEALFWQAEEARGLNKNKDWSQSEAKQWKRIHKDGWNKTKSQKKDVHSRAVLITDAYLQLCLHAGTTHGFGGKKNRKRQHTSDNERWGFKTGMCHKLQGGVSIKYAKRYEWVCVLVQTNLHEDRVKSWWNHSQPEPTGLSPPCVQKQHTHRDTDICRLLKSS